MSNQEKNRILEEPTQFVGQLFIADKAYPVEFDLQTDEMYNLSIRFSKPEQDLVWAIKLNFSQPGEPMTPYKISGKSDKGWEFSTSDYIPDYPNDDALIGKLYNAEVFMPWDEPATRLGYECWFRGFQAWDVTKIETPLGTAGVEATVRVEHDRQKVTGRMAVISDDEQDSDDWLADVVVFAQHMQSGLSFIDGGWVSVPLRRFCFPAGSRWYFHRVSSAQREFPPEHALNNKEMIEALMRNYFSDNRVRDELWETVSWMYLPTTSIAGRFLGAMTAIELWLSLEFQSEEEFAHVSEEQFEELFEKLIGEVKSSDMPQSLKSGADQKLKNLRQISLNRKIAVAFEKAGISRNDISSDILSKLVSRRNKMIHEGRWLQSGKDWTMVFLAREIITRIILHTLDFHGSYDSFLGGTSHRRKFPDCTRQN